MQWIKFVGYCLLMTAVGCGSGKPQKAKAIKPAKVTRLPVETELATVTLTPKATARLDIRTVKVVRKKMPRFRTYAGEVMIPEGRTLTVTAPLTGTAIPPTSGSLPKAGSRAKSGQELMILKPLLAPDRFVPTPAERVAMANAQASVLSMQIVADGDVKQGKEQVEAAKIALRRAQDLLSSGAGSRRARDDAQAALSIAEKGLDAAQQRKDRLAKLKVDPDNRKVSPLPLMAPQSGLINRVFVAPGQMIAGGSPLFEIVDLSTVWVRAPVYVGDQSKIDPKGKVTIRGTAPDQPALTSDARRAPAPPSANPLNATVNIFFELDNSKLQLRPGERADVIFPLKDEEESLVVPWDSILYDIHGSTWVYVEKDTSVYQRVRVQVRHVIGNEAVLATGPEPSTAVVTHGAAELFGTELGTGK